MKVKKYRKGGHFKSLNELVLWIDLGHWVFMRNKPFHPGWVYSLQFRYVCRMFRNDLIEKAVPTKEYIQKLQEQEVKHEAVHRN